MVRRWLILLALPLLVICFVGVLLTAYVTSSEPPCPPISRPIMALPYRDTGQIRVEYVTSESGSKERVTTYSTHVTKVEIEAYYERTMKANNWWSERGGNISDALYYWFSNHRVESCVAGGSVDVVVTSGVPTKVQVIERGYGVEQADLPK